MLLREKLKRSALLLIFTLLFSESPSSAQQFTAGIKFATQITEATPFGLTSFDHLALGPEVQVWLLHRLGLEVNALHEHYAVNNAFIDAQMGVAGLTNQHLSYWDFPILLNWTLSQRRFLPLAVGSGMSTRRTTGSEVDITIKSPIPQAVGSVFRPSSSTFLNTWTHGIVFGATTSYAIDHFRISPEFRYTHWTEPAVFRPGPANTNDFQILVGLTLGNH